ncbi:MAG: hypothetical protein K0V04_11880 [Deltaproteobacteria bacterium]|nr:hypothetical protein [Deltaproteobacteria bacterium]
MELLVFARNYRPWNATADRPSRRDAGVVVGTGRVAPWREGRLCSFVEVRMPGEVVDPGTVIELLVGKAFASWGHPGGGRVLRNATAQGHVSMLLEPGFERARDLCRALLPVLPQARALLDRARQDTRDDALGAVPRRVVLPEDERTAPLPLPDASPALQFTPPRLRAAELVTPGSTRVGGTTRTSRPLRPRWH